MFKNLLIVTFITPAIVGFSSYDKQTGFGLVGPAAAQGCHSSYAGVCIAPGPSDVDCAGGSGNGPRYVRGPVQVIGFDQYGLDRDGDGIGCERG